MRNKLNSRDERMDGLSPDPLLRELLSSAYPAEDILPWARLEALVESAPAVRPGFAARWQFAFGSPGRSQSLRPAFGAFGVMLVAAGVLFAAPAQSVRVGTIITAKQPVNWSLDSGVAEMRQSAKEHFAGLGIPDSELYVMVLPRDGRNDIAFTMLNVDEDSARGFFSEFSSDYPALAALEVSYRSVDSQEYPNLLYQTVLGIAERAGGKEKDPAKLRAQMLRELRTQGFEDINIDLRTREDGSIVIEIDAEMQIEVSKGHSQEELQDVGLDSELLGGETYTELLGEMGLQK